MRWLVILGLLGLAGCGGTAEVTDAPTVAPGSPTAAASASASEESSPSPTQAATPSASAEGDLCDLVLAAEDAPDGTVASEPVVETLDDYRDAVEHSEEGSPGRASAEANLENYESWGLVERCSVGFSAEAGGTSFSSYAVRFEDEAGAKGYVDFLQEGCEVLELPASVGVDATGVLCEFGVPTVYIAATDGPLVQAISAVGSPGSDGTALVDQVTALVPALLAP